MKNRLYERTVHKRDVPEAHPSFAQEIILTEEVNGFAIFRTSYVDGDDNCGPEIIKFVYGTTYRERAQAVEAAVALVTDTIEKLDGEVS